MNETSIQINETFYRWFNFALARFENVHVEICAYLFEMKLNGIFFQKKFLSYTVRKIVLVNETSFWNLRLKAENLQKVWDY